MQDEANGKKTAALVSRLREKAVAAYRRFLAIRGEPKEIAAGLALGVFIGMTPTMGFQAIPAVLLASLFRVNKIAAAAGVFITNPITAPFIYYVTYLTGALFYHPQSIADPSVEAASGALAKLFDKAPDVLADLVIGGVVLGLPLALLTYRISLLAILRYRERVKQSLLREKEIFSRAGKDLVGRVKDRKKRKKKKKARNR